MGRATETFEATGGDVHTQCLSALTCRCFEEFAQTPRLWLMRANPLLQLGYCNRSCAPSSCWLLSLHLECKAGYFPKLETQECGAHSGRVTSSPCSEVLCPDLDHPLPNNCLAESGRNAENWEIWFSDGDHLQPKLCVCETTSSCRAPGTEGKHCKRFQSGKGRRDWCTE